MIDINDAPWIREAETYGPDCAEEIEYSCPVCGAEEPEDFILDLQDNIIGCSCCCRRRDAYEYMAQKLADERYAG